MSSKILDLCLEYYGLDPAHYFTLPHFAWGAMLLKTGVEMDPLTDQEMYEMIEKGLRGGMCQVSHKEAKVNNKYMGEDHDKERPSNYINYLYRCPQPLWTGNVNETTHRKTEVDKEDTDQKDDNGLESEQ